MILRGTFIDGNAEIIKPILRYAGREQHEIGGQ